MTIFGEKIREFKIFFKLLFDTLTLVTKSTDNPHDIIIYSEGKNFWPHFHGLISTLIMNSCEKVTYLTSSSDDPGLFFDHDNYNSFFVGNGGCRDFIFRNLNAKVMAMTTPDLENYQIKKSIHGTKYVYVQHSLISLHMGYNKDAFKFFDTICCASHNHYLEAKKMFGSDSKHPNKLLKHGYPRAESLQRSQSLVSGNKKLKKIALIAPTWGASSIIERGASNKIVSQLLSLNFAVILRPHPETLKRNKKSFVRVVNEFSSNPDFTYEVNVDGETSLLNADLMISDCSGAALEFGIALSKPVIFFDTEPKIKNKNYQQIGLPAFETEIREKIGVIWGGSENLNTAIKDAFLKNRKTDKNLAMKHIYNLGTADAVLADFLIKIKNGFNHQEEVLLE